MNVRIIRCCENVSTVSKLTFSMKSLNLNSYIITKTITRESNYVTPYNVSLSIYYFEIKNQLKNNATSMLQLHYLLEFHMYAIRNMC